jgi:hypothetical protein
VRIREGADQAIVKDPLSSSSERSKEVFIGGKRVVFEGSRKGTAVALIFLLAVLLYGGFLGIQHFLREVEHASKTAQKLREEAALRAEAAREKEARKKPPPKVADAELPKAIVPEEPPTVGDKPRRMGGIEVQVIDAKVGLFEPGQTEQRMAIALRITNHSERRMKYLPWSDPANKAELRDGTPAATKYSLIGGTGQAARDLEPGAAIQDVLFFPPTPTLFGVDLVLPIGVGIERFRFTLPPQFIERQ